jgi:hypothetical protein
MPVLRDNRKIKKLELPESGITIRIRDGILASDVEAVDKEKNQIKQTMIMISRLMVDWDATAENGQALPVTPENVALLSVKDLQFIQDNLDFVKDFLEEGKIQDTR